MSISTTALFCCLDDFARSFEEWEKARSIGTPRPRHRPGKLSLSEMPSYGRFVSLMPRLFIPFCVLIHSLSGEQTGIYIADSTKLAICHNLRISRSKVFKGLAARGKTTTGWFYGFKLHLIINHKGEIMAVKIIPGNTDDRAPLEAMGTELEGKLLADKGYISKELFASLWNRELHLPTVIRKKMKNYLMPVTDKLLLRKQIYH